MSAQSTKTASPLLVILAFAIVYIVWGSTYFFIQKALKGFPPFMLGAVRFTIAGILMLAWCKFKGEDIFDKDTVKHSSISGILLLFVSMGIVIWVEQYLPSGLVAIMVSSAAIWFVLLDKPKWKENFNNKSTIAGLVIGFLGVILLFAEQIFRTFSSGHGQTNIIGMVMLILGPMAWSGGSLYSKYKSTVKSSASVNSSWQMVAAAIAFAVVSILRGETHEMSFNSISAEAWWSMAYLIVFGSLAAFSAYVWLLQVRPATQVSTYAYVNPVVAVLLSVFFAKEVITVVQVLGLLIILGSVLLINMAKYRKEKSAGKLQPEMVYK